MSLRATVAFIAALVSLPAAAETPSVKTGVLTDMRSSYADDDGGPGSVIAAEMAIADSGMPDKVQIVSADTLNQPDNASALAVFDVPTSGIALAVNDEAGRSHKLVFFSTTIHDSPYPWDYYRITGMVPGEQAFRKLADSRCAMTTCTWTPPRK